MGAARARGLARAGLHLRRLRDARFFPELRLSYAENLLRSRVPEDAARGALVAHSPHAPPTRLTRGELSGRVLSVAGHLRKLGVGAGSRVAAVTGNTAEAAVAGLATAAVGASFSSASPEMAVPTILDRFRQLEPAILMTQLVANGAASPHALDEQIRDLVGSLPSLRAVVALDEGPTPSRLRVPLVNLSEMQGDGAGHWERLPFNHPLFVLFTSGTTGPPKCLVHGAGGTLLEHVKEHRLHVDLRPGERLFFHTSAAWMMWNWQLSALASGAELVLYDGPVDGPERLWDLVRNERVDVFGTSPPYLQLCQDSGFSPPPLPQLRAILSTGSILHDWQYDWVYEHLGPIALQSISGGTDIIGCFVLGNPDLPVRRGMLQCRSLGMDVQATAVDPEGAPAAELPAGVVGELVCRNPFPSRPLGFLNDRDGQFHRAYFSRHPGVWTHGDLIEFDADGQARIHGRSDGVLNVRGERIGPAEIYRALRGIGEVAEAMAVELEQPDGENAIALLVVLRAGAELDRRLVVAIRREILANASAAHAPMLVLQVQTLPVTHSGKRSERAARDAVNGGPVSNPQAVANPESLVEIRDAARAALQRQHEAEAEAGRSPDSPTDERVLEIWEAVLGIPLEPDDNFFELGGTSLTAVRVLQAIEERIGVELPPSVFVFAQTPRRMAAVIDGPVEQRAPILVPLRAGSGDGPLFVVHALAGDVLQLRPLALALDTARPVYGLQARGLDPRFEPQVAVEEMAATYVELVRSVQPRGPFMLAGYSFGGLVAYEMARMLCDADEEVGLLALIDTDLHPASLPPLARARFLAGRPFRYLVHIAAAPRTQVPLFARKLLRALAPGLIGEEDRELPPRLAELERIGLRAFAAYRPGPYDGAATLFLTEPRPPAFCHPRKAWRRFFGEELTVERIDGDHDSAVAAENVGPLAARLSELLSSAEAA